MQRCCPHRESPSSPRNFAAGVLGTKSFQEIVLRFRNRTTGRPPADRSFAIATVLRKTFIEQGCRACRYLRLDRGWYPRSSGSSYGESPSPVKYIGQCGAIHSAAFQASEAGSEPPI